VEPDPDGRDVVSYSQLEGPDADGLYQGPVEVDAGLDYQAGGLYDDSAAVLDDDPDGAADSPDGWRGPDGWHGDGAGLGEDPTELGVATPDVAVSAVTAAEPDAAVTAELDEGVTAELDIDGSLLDSIEQELADVERALALLDEGTYGQCEACDHAIDDAVLARTPTARFCAEHLPLSLR
jgi:hypothetical protein